MSPVTGTKSKERMPPAGRIGRQTLRFRRPPAITATGTVAGPMEGDGPLGHLFDEVAADTLLGQKSWEQAEVRMMGKAVEIALGKRNLGPGEIDFLVCGDLLNQITTSAFAARTLDRPFFGVYAACACWAEAMTLAAALLDGEYAERAVVAVSSHHDSAERQFRFPTEFGAQRPPTSTWTVTGAGAAVLERHGDGPVITYATPGRIVDIGEKNPYDLGSAMAPAAADTLVAHFQDTGRSPLDYDLVATGDLGRVGMPIARDLALEAGYALDPILDDCGVRLYRSDQDVHAGGSGCACSALAFLGRFYPDLAGGRMRRLLLVATGAMFSPTSFQQGESIPSIAYAVSIEAQTAGETR